MNDGRYSLKIFLKYQYLKIMLKIPELRQHIPMPSLPANFCRGYDGTPVGTVVAYAGKIGKPKSLPDSSLPDTTPATSPPVIPAIEPLEAYGWMVCDGRQLYVSQYPELYAILGFLYVKEGESKTLPESSNAAEKTMFRIPDYRGYFLRCVDYGAGNDPDVSARKLPDKSSNNGVGSIQEDALQLHNHDYDKISALGSGTALTAGQGAITTVGSDLTGEPTNVKPNSGAKNTVRVAKETRAKNIYVNYIIKFMSLSEQVAAGNFYTTP